jgi:2-amino-4-hydroxy-6-hydroxymethyldihydropteridine diphosphokinase
LIWFPVYLGFGSNIADRESFLKQGLDCLTSRNHFRITRISSLYETEPKYLKEQDYFYNFVAEGSTDLDANRLLSYCKKIEQDLGRDFQQIRYGPRRIDIDILFFANQIIHNDRLDIPHPGIAERKFVLQPLAEIAPEYIHPVLKVPISELLRSCKDQSYVSKIKDLNFWISA